MNRRSFISSAGALLTSKSLYAALPLQTKQDKAPSAGKADHAIRIEPCTLEISPGVTIKTLAYNGQVPGPLAAIARRRPGHHRRDQRRHRIRTWFTGMASRSIR